MAVALDVAVALAVVVAVADVDLHRGSAHECGAVYDASRILGVVDEQAFIQGKTLLVRIVSMLIRMTQ